MVVWITVAVIAVIVSPLVAFHNLRKDRDKLKEELDRAQEEFYFEPTGVSCSK